MPKARKSASANALTGAAALIAKASRGQHAPDPSDEAMAELAALIKHNDSAPHTRRVSLDAALEMLRGFGWQGARPALDSLCRRRFGRRSYATP